MNENINLVEILQDCPKGTQLYSPLFGKVYLDRVIREVVRDSYISIRSANGCLHSFRKNGTFGFGDENGEIMLFPSKEQKDWSKFKCSKLKFNPKTLLPFEKVLVRDYSSCYWKCDLFSNIDDSTSNHKYITISSAYICCIPYNNDTKHLVGTSNKAPEYYRYWEE